MKKIVSIIIVFAFFANVSAQLKVNSSGETTTNNIFTFKVNNVLAGFTGSSTNSNVSFGFSALRNTTGMYNTAIGYNVLSYNKTGTYNTAIGYYANAGAGNVSNLTNTTVIGAGALATASNQIVIGYNATPPASATSNQAIIGNSSITKIGGYVTWTTYPSDSRTKKNIQAKVPGLTFINLLQPVTYNLDLDAIDELQKSDDPKINALRDSLFMSRSSEEKEIEAKARANKEKQVYSGFVAQDVEKAAQSVGYDFSGVDAPENGKGTYGLRYAEFVVPLVKAVQELSEQNNQLLKTVETLKQKIEKLEENTPVISLRSNTEENSVTDLSDIIIEQCKLYQNAPNPFSQSTQIKYYLPQDVKTACLCIYNLQGTQIKQITITQRGEDSQWISGSELTAGMYLYALIVDGKEVDTKRMILTK